MSNSYKSNHREPAIVLGLGNTLMRDEAVGVLIVRALEQEHKHFPDFEFADYGTAGMRILHGIANRTKAVIVDCARMGASPGDIRRFTPDDVHSIKRMPGFSLHEGDFLSVLELSRQLGECPEKIVIFGIEPADVSPGESLSDLVAEKFDQYLKVVRGELV